jgi:copper resistance protein C
VSRLARVLLGAAVAAAAVLAVGAPAQAHNYVVSTIPEDGAVLTELPAQFSVTTNDNLLNLGGNGHGFVMQIRGADGAYYGDGCVTVSGPAMSTDAALGEPGDYTIVWQLVSTDGHSASGEVSFTWQPTAANEVASAGSKTPPDCHGTQTANSSGTAEAPASPPVAAAVPLDNVLWIGGAIVLVGLAVLVTLLVLGRRTNEG